MFAFEGLFGRNKLFLLRLIAYEIKNARVISLTNS